MTRLIPLAACVALLGCRSTPPPSETDAPVDRDTAPPEDTSVEGETGDIPTGESPVFVTFFSHNEAAPYWESLSEDRDEYDRYRADLVARVELLASYGATLNWQTDESALRAMARNEGRQDLAATGGKPVLRWMVEDMGVQVDPHTHAHGPYNYADITHLIGTLDVEASGVVGGVALMDCGDEKGEFEFADWTDELEIDDDGLIHGRRFEQVSWRPTVLTQVAMPEHVIDEFSSGVWRPEPTDFYAQDGDGLAYVGQGYPRDRRLMGDSTSSGIPIVYEDLGYIHELVSMIGEGRLRPGIHTASVRLLDQPMLDGREPTYGMLEHALEVLEPLHERGEIVYLDYEGVVAIWEREYDAQPNRVGIEEFSAWDMIFEPVDEACW